MEKQEFSFLSADGKTPIHAAEWVPAGPVRAIVELSHGVSEHILRYEPLASYLTQRGFAVMGHDHLGHGSSVIPGAPRLYLGASGQLGNRRPRS
ncbi:MAG: alpha/beta hydrolase [Dysosmobacter sp.]